MEALATSRLWRVGRTPGGSVHSTPRAVRRLGADHRTIGHDPRWGAPAFPPREKEAQGVWGTAGTTEGGAVTGNQLAGRATEVVMGSDSQWDLDRQPTGRTCFQIEQEARKGRNQGLKNCLESRRCHLVWEEGAWGGEELCGSSGSRSCQWSGCGAAGPSRLDLRAGQRSHAF